MSICPTCRESGQVIAASLGACAQCFRNGEAGATRRAEAAHSKCRSDFDLAATPPRHTGGIVCTVCANRCRMGPEQAGYCGLRSVHNGELSGVPDGEGKASWYHDPLPTNCVADWVCAGGTGAGYPRFTLRDGPELGYHNLAVFLHACTFDCLYCQNWTYRLETLNPRTVSTEELAQTVTETTSCICYFGGDPSAQAPFALEASRIAVRNHGERTLRICWETNGYESTDYLNQMVEISLVTGGCIKFDLKAWNRDLHRAITGVSNQPVLENFQRAAQRTAERPDPPLVVASTLMVPGYVDEEEVGNIASFIAAIDPSIPYSLLAFHPQFRMTDLPTTSREQAGSCLAAARDAGLERVKVGNVHLLR